MKDYPTTNKEELNRWTALLEALFLCIAEAAQKYQKQYYFGGGIAIDLTFGGFTRLHADLDFYPEEEDTAWWQEWFRSQGYIVSTDEEISVESTLFKRAFGETRYSESEWRGHSNAHSRCIVTQNTQSPDRQKAAAHCDHM